MTRAAIHNYVLDGVQRGNFFGGEQVRKTEVELRVRKFKDRKAAGKIEVNKKRVKKEGYIVVD